MNLKMRVEESEIYQDMKQYSRNTYAENIRISTEYLKQNGIVYSGEGRRLVVGNIVFYPGTGQWYENGETLIRFGVRNLVKYLKTINSGGSHGL